MKKITISILTLILLTAVFCSAATNWKDHQMVVDIGEEGTYDTDYAYGPTVIKDGSVYEMWYTGRTSNNGRILFCNSTDGKNWNNHQMVVDIGEEGTYDAGHATYPTVIKDGSTYKMWYTGSDGGNNRIIYCDSNDGKNWNNHQLVVDLGDEGTYDTVYAYGPTVVKDGSVYHMWYTGREGTNYRIIYCNSTDGKNWNNHQVVVDIGDEGTYDTTRSANPTVKKEGSVYHMWYTGRDASNDRIIYCNSTDGKNWNNHQVVVDIGEEGTYDTTGSIAPETLLDNNIYKMWYQGYDGSNYHILYAEEDPCPSGMVSYWPMDESDVGNDLDSSDTGLWNGLISLWHFDESSGTLNDAKGSNDGTQSGGVTYGEPGVFGTALSFDGVDDYVSLPAIIDNASTTYSVSAWVKADAASTNTRLFSQRTTPNSIVASLNYYSNRTSFAVRDKDDQIAVASGTDSSAPPDEWHHFVGVRNGNNVYLYVDGVLDASGSQTFNPILQAPNAAIGKASHTTTDYFKGLIDEVGVWSRALSASEVQELYNKAVVEDSKGINNGTNVGTTSTTGKVNNGLDFDGTQFITLPNTDSLKPTDFTISAWIKTTTTNAFLFSNYDRTTSSPEERGYRMYVNPSGGSGHLSCQINNYGAAPDFTGHTSLIDNQWHHVVVVYDDSATENTYYVDGSQEPNTGDAVASIQYYTDAYPVIGNAHNTKSYNDYYNVALFNGTMDEVAIFDKALSASEVQDLYNKGNSGEGLCQAAVSTPTYDNFTDSETTNFSEADDITNVTNVTLAVTGKGKIKFPESYGINAENQDFDSNIVIDDEFISVNTAALDSSFNSSATISIEGVTCPVDVITYKEGSFAAKDDILAGGSNCILDGVCSNVVCSAGTLTFDVAHFTGFAAGGNANLTIWADSGIYYENQSVGFHASYINSTDATPLSGECNISFSDAWGTWYEMDYNGSEYNYSRNFTTAGLKNYNVSCYNSSYIELEANDSKLITSLSGDVPEFSLLTLGLGLAIILAGLFFFRRK